MVDKADGDGGNDDRGLNMLLRRRAPPRKPPNPPEPKVMPTSSADDGPIVSRPVIQPLCVRIPVAAQMLGIGRSKVYHLINGGELETIKLGDAVLITTRSLEAFVSRHATFRPK
ncbi:helix-turn-helix domain-containing protein [Sphingomonas abietis]|uniref:Helix-turn-helix domain-containing protein n=1 Tax=Sphingomonas abietis TaxID=3012344 RepID=A0ABY7NJQ2_9SPHN|nr:helix-turn-helix domain-containing protein [Sphingomonas abietis]WBO21709.1 helix-turn-helix domain-containing protein [Sphingomonas abietis]